MSCLAAIKKHFYGRIKTDRAWEKVGIKRIAKEKLSPHNSFVPKLHHVKQV